MQNKLGLSLLLALGLASPPAFAAITSPGGSGILIGTEPSLYSLLGFADNAALNAAAVGNFSADLSSGNSYTTLVIEIAGNAGNNIFGVYNPVTKSELQVFPGSASPVTSETLIYDSVNHKVSIGSPSGPSLTLPSSGADANTFGFYLDNGLSGSGHKTYYSITADNEAVSGHKYDQMAAVDLAATKYANAGNSGYVLAWEDLQVGNGSDRDFNDMVVTFTAQPLPEPTTLLAGALLLLPFGASSLRLVRRSRIA